MRKRKVLIAFLCFLTNFCVNAQTGRHFDADKQLSSSYTTQLYIDRDGFFWAATRNGLNRYDGYQTRIFKKEQKDALGMASNYVNCMLQDRNGLFYIGMYGAFQTYDGERFNDIKTYDLDGNHMPSYITCLLERKNGDILVGTSGRGVMRMVNKQEARQMGGVLKDLVTVHRLIEDNRQHIWIVTDDRGLLRYDGKKVYRYFDQNDQASNVLEVCQDHQGRIYAGTRNAGLYRMDGDTPVHIESTGNKHISTLYVNHSGKIMIGYDGMGMAVYDPQSNTLKDNPFYSREVDLSTAKVYSICEDDNGNIWLGLLQKGVFMQPGKTTGFRYMGYKLGARNVIGTACVTSVMVGSNGYSWIGTDKDGLYCLDQNYHVLRHFKENFPATILSIKEDGAGRVWLGTYKEGCGWIDPQGLTYHPQDLAQDPRISVFDLAPAPDGTLWIATMGQGLLRYDTKRGGIKQYLMAENAGTDRKVNSIANNYISKIALSPDNKRIYVATSMGVCAMDIEKEDWLSTFNGQNTPNYGVPVRIAREFGGKLRIGTNDGLFCYDLKSHKMERHGIESGLADNGISSIEEDKQGNLWIGTDHGLCCVNTMNQTVSNYFVDNGLQSNEFSDGASWVAPNGKLIFGGLGGITWFDPKEIKEREWKAEVKLTGFSVNGEPVTPATMSSFWKITNSPVISSNRFVLGPSDNSFAIQLSTLTYDNPEHIIYRYRINNEEWVRMQPGVNEITFSHLSPGNYDFCVVAEQNGISTPERCFTVVIHAPWYRTPLAYLIYILIAAALFWWYRKSHRRREQERLRMQEHIHAEEMADAKLRFFMNISHEIRTPMTLIVSPLLSLIKQDEDPHRRSVYETIRRNAERILGLINQMMDLRKIDKGQMVMHMCETDLIGFIGDIYTLFAQQAKAKSIKFSYEHDDNILPVWVDRGNFDKIIVNILSNAFKFTPAGGDIRIRVSHDGNQASIAIKDSGEGIPEDKLERIFERFYQSPSSVNDRNVGTGIGLDLTRSLVELHHGTIEAHNNSDGKGCEFVVNIPLGCSHLKPEEMIVEKQDVAHGTSLMDNDTVTEEPVAQEELPKMNRRQKLVVVEDDAEIRDYLDTELSTDYDIIKCTNGKEGLQATLKELPDLVISDIMMPEMDGNTLCSKIKTNATTSHIPVILLTAKSREEDQLEGLATGADAYIVKPFNMDILRRTIVNLIHSHQLLQLKYGRNDQLEELVEDIKMKSPDEKLLERVMTVINKNLGNSDLSVDKIADEVGISRVHLHRKMKELTGQTPHDFIRNIRLKKAASLLSLGDMNVSEVMYACGFSNAASFSTVFKKLYGVSPREFMNEHQERNSDK